MLDSGYLGVVLGDVMSRGIGGGAVDGGMMVVGVMVVGVVVVV